LPGIPEARAIFHVVFFVVLVSVLAQGTTLTPVARWLKVLTPPEKAADDSHPTHRLSEQLRELVIPPESPVIHRTIVELGLPEGFLIVLVRREAESVIPNGNTEIRAGDRLVVLAGDEVFDQVAGQLAPTA